MNVLAFVHLRNIYRSTGAGRVARELIERVSMKSGVDMHILADREDYASVVPQVGGLWSHFPYHFIENETSTQQAKWILLQRPRAASYWPEAQVTHCTTESYVPKGNSRLIVTVHDAAYFDGAHPRCFATYKQRLKWSILYGTLARFADAFHTVSEFSAERLSLAFPMIRSRIRVIHNAVSDFFFGAPDTIGDHRVLEELGLSQRPYVLLPGGLHYRKNAELVLQAWPRLRELLRGAQLVITGHNSPEYDVRAKVLGDSVVRTGFVDDRTLRALYGNSQVVWFPTRYEGFGIPVLEAMACGAPVVASDTTAIPEIAGDAALLANSTAVGAHVDAVEAAFSDAALRTKLIMKGRRRAAEFTWDAAATKLHGLYAQFA